MFYECATLCRGCNQFGRISRILTLQWGGSRSGRPFLLLGYDPDQVRNRLVVTMGTVNMYILDSLGLRKSLSLDEGSAMARVAQRSGNHASSSYDVFSLSSPSRAPGLVLVLACFGAQVTTDEATRRRVPATEDVPLLWTDNPAPETILSGMRKVSQTSIKVRLHDLARIP